MKEPRLVISLRDFLYGLNLAEKIEFYHIKKGTEMDSKIAGIVRFESLKKTEPRICVIEDGEKTFYYSDGKFKTTGSVVLDLITNPMHDFEDSIIDNAGDPINLPSNLNDPIAQKFLMSYNFFDGSSSIDQLSFDWLKTKDALLRMCRYYNIFSLDDRERAWKNKSSSINWRDYDRRDYDRDESNKHRYIITYNYETPESNSFIRVKPIISLHIVRGIYPNTGSSYIINGTPFVFINQKAATIFIENFKDEIINVLSEWRKALFHRPRANTID